jgi:DNA polymerase/3'-5' exonuclease PolX
MSNQKLAKIFYETADLLEIEGGLVFRINAYRKAANIIENLQKDLSLIYNEQGMKGLKEIRGIGDGTRKKIEEFLKKGKIKYYEELKEKNAIRDVVTYYFKTKGVSLDELKKNAKKRKIIYSRFTKPAKELILLSGSVEKAKEAIKKVAEWASSRNLDYAIETVFKKWLEMDRLRPKEIVKKPFFQGKQMIWSETRKKWYVISDSGEWLEFAGKKAEIEWKTTN